MTRRVWITGMGVVSAAGDGCGALAGLLREERTAMQPNAELGGRLAGRAQTAHGADRRLDRTAALLIATANEAWRNAGLDEQCDVPERSALIEGSSLGPLAASLDAHAARLSAPVRSLPRPSALLRFLGGAGGAAIARARGIRGSVVQINAGSVSGAHAIGEAYEMIRTGRMDLVIAGGTECPLHPEIADHFEAAGLLAEGEGDVAGCLPFDLRRSGTSLGEGAASLILESEEHARRRGASPLAIVRGFGLACEAFSATSPDPSGRGVSTAIAQALREVAPTDIAWIKAHGTGTRANDLAECRGLVAALGASASAMPMTGLKSTLGHSLGASGATEAVASILALREGFVPATVSTRDVDPALGPCHVAMRRESVSRRVALLLAEGFGGHCAALALEAA